MNLAEPSTESSPRRPTTEVWRATLSRIPTLFGRMVFLSSLREPESGRYSHESLDYLSKEDADRMLRNSHQQVFQQWISGGLEEQKADLDEYLGTGSSPRYALPYRNLVPAAAREVERQLYLTDLETLLELLRFEHEDAF